MDPFMRSSDAFPASAPIVPRSIVSSRDAARGSMLTHSPRVARAVEVEAQRAVSRSAPAKFLPLAKHKVRSSSTACHGALASVRAAQWAAWISLKEMKSAQVSKQSNAERSARTPSRQNRLLQKTRTIKRKGFIGRGKLKRDWSHRLSVDE